MVHSNVIKASMETYRTALMLNNMAVCLVRRGFLAEASKAIALSTQVLQLSISGRNDGNAAVIPAERIENVTSKFATTYGKQKTILFDINPVDDNDLASLQDAAKYGPSCSVFFPIRIFFEGLPSEQEVTEILRHFAILLYNRGIINLMVSLSSPQAQNKRGGARGLHSARMSLECSANALSMVEKDFVTGAREDILSILLLKTLILNDLISVYLAQNRATEIDEIHSCVSSLRSRVEYLNNDIRNKCDSGKLNAAASA